MGAVQSIINHYCPQWEAINGWTPNAFHDGTSSLGLWPLADEVSPGQGGWREGRNDM